jgi:hypothetical protein
MHINECLEINLYTEWKNIWRENAKEVKLIILISFLFIKYKLLMSV